MFVLHAMCTRGAPHHIWPKIFLKTYHKDFSSHIKKICRDDMITLIARLVGVAFDGLEPMRDRHHIVDFCWIDVHYYVHQCW